MNYKIVFNIPNEKFPTEVMVDESQMRAIEPALNDKKTIKINGSYFNTAYFAKAIPDTHENRIESSNILQIDEKSNDTRIKENKEKLDAIRQELKDKHIIKK
jgi:hypothetical protein